MSPAQRPLPNIHEPLMQPFWSAAKQHVLVVQKCADCGDARFPPLPVCPECWSESQMWDEVEATGTVWSYVIYHRAMNQAFADDVPYAIGRVKVDAGPMFTVRLDVPLGEIRVDMRVIASFKDVSEEVSLLEFTTK